MRSLRKIALLGFIIMSFFVSCASAPSRSPSRPASPAVNDVVTGHGEGESLGQALSRAKIDAIRKGVEILIGREALANNMERIKKVLFDTSNPNAYLYMDTLETLKKDNTGTIDEPNYVYELKIRVRLDAIKKVLDANAIATEAGADAKDGRAKELVEDEMRDEPLPPFKPEKLSPEEEEFLSNYLDKLTYMVYFDEKSAEDEFLIKSAISMANNYLLSQGYSLIDLEQIEKLKNDQQLLYEEETGKELSLIQWIAQKLNADVYIELDAVTEGQSKDDKYYGSAKVTLKIFEASTGVLLGAIPYSSPRTFSKVSEFDAISNALQSTVYKAMAAAVKQTRNVLSGKYRDGIQYDLVLQSTPDQKTIARFRSKLRNKDKVKDIKTIYQSSEETKFAVYFLGSVEELEELIYDVSDSIPGMEYIEPVVIRGKSLTFDTGLE
ncbi:DUF6175 family protein [Spirochaetia bacterium 38H-sp]|uniref:DUF6175 family protein n=1 Tax=Rarispira pelagica TaxID=3141764 RepID=A0ABU9UA16_9SPIR